MAPDRFIRDMGLYLMLKGRADSFFDFEKKYPDCAFSERFIDFRVYDFSWLKSRAFWSSMLSVLKDGERVFFLTIDPDPVVDFYNHFRYFNCLELDVFVSPEQYRLLLSYAPQSSPASSIEDSSDRIVIFSESYSWAIYGEYDADVCFLGFSDEYQSARSWPEWHSLDSKFVKEGLVDVSKYRLRRSASR